MRVICQSLLPQPFTTELWMWNLGFILLVSATVTTITDYGNDHDFVNDRWVSRWLKGAYMNAMGCIPSSCLLVLVWLLLLHTPSALVPEPSSPRVLSHRCCHTTLPRQYMLSAGKAVLERGVRACTCVASSSDRAGAF